MPLYDVRCIKCSKVSEIVAKMSDEKFECPECGNEALKLVSPITTERRFAGQECISSRYWFLPQEVAEKRAMMGEAGNMIQDNGEVHFTKRSDATKFNQVFMDRVFAR